jgi:hypothetical protein
MFGRDIRVTTDAIIRPVRRKLELGGIHEQGNGVAGRIRPEQRVIAVTIEAITVLHARGRRRCRQQQKQRNQPRDNIFHPLMFALILQIRLHLPCQLLAGF